MHIHKTTLPTVAVSCFLSCFFHKLDITQSQDILLIGIWYFTTKTTNGFITHLFSSINKYPRITSVVCKLRSLRERLGRGVKGTGTSDIATFTSGPLC